MNGGPNPSPAYAKPGPIPKGLKMADAVIVSATRTPVGKYGRALRDIPAAELGAVCIREALRRAHVEPGGVEEVIMGNVIQAGVGQAPARQAALRAGLPPAVGALTVNKVCASGLKAVTLASDAIRAGSLDVVVAGGMESMSKAPYLLMDARWGYRHGDGQVVDAMIHDGLWDAFENFHMGVTGDIIAEKYRVSREEQDMFALESHRRAARATKEGRFKDEIVPVEVEGPKGKEPFEVDEGIRFDSSLDKLSRLPPVFQKNGTVTAGNASQLSDGGSALMVMSDARASDLGVKPMARIVGYRTGGVAPKYVMEAPIPTVQALLKRIGWTIDDIDLFEHNEAYAAASWAVAHELGIPFDKLNVNGGAVALGHPLGCSGARILTTLLHEMQRRKAERGLATLCLGGGNAVAVAVERV